MMKTAHFFGRLSVVAAVGLFVLGSPLRVWSADPAKQCLKDARGDHADCVAVCADNFNAAAALCGTTCVQQCGTDRIACRQPIQDQLAADVKACNDTLAGAIKSCRHQAKADPNFDKNACIAKAQIDAFICRDDAREAAFPQLNQCRETFQACILACP
jgi:hypothetical protein